MTENHPSIDRKFGQVKVLSTYKILKAKAFNEDID